MRYTPLVLLQGTPLVFLCRSLPFPGKSQWMILKYFERTLILNPWAGKFYPFFAVNFNSGFTIKLQNKEQCFHFCAMGKGLPNMIR